MSGLSYDDPFVVDTSAATGSVSLNASAATATKKYYLKLTGIPQDRLTYPVATETGGAVLPTNSDRWRAYSAAYAQEQAGLGSWFGAGSNLMASGRDVIVILTFTTVGTFTWAWTSKDASPHRPYTWLQADQLTPPSGGSLTYDGLGGGIPDLDYFTERFYWIEPTTADPITVSVNEPSGYFEVYHETTGGPFDDYIEYGENLPNGSPEHVLQFTPTPGERYVVYLDTSGAPTKATEYQLTWTGASITPPPYVVDNDDISAPISLPLATATGSFGYDNTGATEDAEISGKRSIWYTFTLTTSQIVRFTATAGEASAGNVPAMWVGKVNGEQLGSSGGEGHNPLTLTAEAGIQYKLQVYFDAALATDPWDDSGSIAWQLTTAPANSDLGHPTAISVGPGQNTPVVGAVPGYTGNGLYYSITAPRDGGLNVVVETSSPSGQYAWIYDGAGTLISPVPVRASGATTPRAWLRKVLAGDVFIVQVNVTVSDAVLRWGMSQPTWGEWHSSARADVEGAESGIPSGVKDWTPVGIGGDPNFANGQVIWDTHSIKMLAEDLQKDQVSTAQINTIPLNGILGAVSTGNGDSVRFSVDGGSADGAHGDAGDIGWWQGPQEEWNGYSAWGLENTPPEIGGGGQITYIQNAAEFTNRRWMQRFVVQSIDEDIWARNLPVIYAATNNIGGFRTGDANEIIDDIPPGVSNPADYVLANIETLYDVEWNTPDGTLGRPKFNLYRPPGQIHWEKHVNAPGVYGVLGPGYYQPPETYFTEVHEIPVSWLDWQTPTLTKSWSLTPDMVLGQPLIQSFTIPIAGGDERGEGIEGVEVAGGGFQDWDESNLLQSDIFPNLAIGNKVEHAYAVVTGLWNTHGVLIGHAGMHPTLNERWGHDAGTVSIDTWPSFQYMVRYEMTHAVLREYPSEYRVAKFTEDLSELEPPSAGPLPGSEASVADAGEYSYMGDVGAAGAVEPPILWFVYQKWGFLGQHFVAYGHGLGNTQPALNGKFYLGVGPPAKYPVPGEFRPPLTQWALYPPGPNAYDGTRVMFPGTSVAPPKVDVEHQVIEFIVPADMTLLEPTEYHLYVVNDHGTSNALSLILYPMIDIDMEAAEPLLLTVTAAMGVYSISELAEPAEPTAGDGRYPAEDLFPSDALYPQEEALAARGVSARLAVSAAAASPLLNWLPQNYSRISAPWVLTGRIPERAPTFLTNAKAAFSLTGGAPATGLDDPVSSALPLPLRYRPLDSKVASRPDLGTGMSAWNSNESSSMDFKWHYLSAPYVDAENVVASRNGSIVRPAMAFPGNAWAESTASFPTGPKMVFAMAVTIFPDPQARSFLLSSFIAGVPDPDSFPIQLFVEGDQLSFVIGAKIQTARIAPGYIGRRPVIIAFTINDTAMTYVLASDKATMRSMTHPKLTAGGLRLYLGRNNNAGSMQMATMDILDLGIDHTAAATTTKLWSVVNRLDGIYGVMK